MKEPSNDANKHKKGKASSKTITGSEPTDPKKKKRKKKKVPKLQEPHEDIIEPEIPKETEAQRYQREIQEEKDKLDREKRAYNALVHMRRRDMLRECVLRGCKFELVVSLSTPQLAGWFTDHLDDGLDVKRLNEFDDFRKTSLLKSGVTEDEINNVYLHPSLKFGEAGDSKDWNKESMEKSTQPKIEVECKKEPDKPKEIRPKRERDGETKIFKGTKKHMTYELTKQGKSLEKIIKLVTKAFPEANESSINIWMRRCLKEMTK